MHELGDHQWVITPCELMRGTISANASADQVRPLGRWLSRSPNRTHDNQRPQAMGNALTRVQLATTLLLQPWLPRRIRSL